LIVDLILHLTDLGLQLIQNIEISPIGLEEMCEINKVLWRRGRILKSFDFLSIIPWQSKAIETLKIL